MTTRNFLVAELKDLGLPDNPVRDMFVRDSIISVDDQTEYRCVIFALDGTFWAVNYRRALPGKPAVDPWGGDTVTAVEMRREEETIIRYRPE